jgi:hypothetical protein
MNRWSDIVNCMNFLSERSPSSLKTMLRDSLSTKDQDCNSVASNASLDCEHLIHLFTNACLPTMCVVKLGNIQYDPGDRLLHDNEVCAPNNNKYKQSGIVRPGLSYVQFCGHICSVVAPRPSHCKSRDETEAPKQCSSKWRITMSSLLSPSSFL